MKRVIKRINHTAFTLMEILVIIVIVGVIATLTTIALNNLRSKSRDVKRISDIRQIQSALEMYKNDNNTYPQYLTPSMSLIGSLNGQTYLSAIPAPPGQLDGNCSSDVYDYQYDSSSNSYSILYCLGDAIQSTGPANCMATHGNICQTCTPDCTSKCSGDSNGCGSTCTASCTMQYVGSAGFSNTAYGFADITAFNGTPYMVYLDSTNSNKVNVMKYDGSSWVQYGSANLSSSISYNLGLANDAAGNMYLAFNDGSAAGNITVKKYSGSDWSAIGAVGFVASANYTSLAVYNDIPYIAFRNSAGRAGVMRFISGSWSDYGAASFSDGLIVYTSIAIDQGVVYVAYRDSANSFKATVMKNDVSGWTPVGSAGFTPGQADAPSLAIYNGTIYISYEDYSVGNKLSVMKYDGTDWVQVGNAGFSEGAVNFNHQLGASSDGNLYAVLSDQGDGDRVDVFKYNGSSWSRISNLLPNTQYAYIYVDGVTPYITYRRSTDQKMSVMKYGP